MSNPPEPAMPALVRTELLALRTIRTSWFLLTASVLATLVLAVTPVINAGREGAASIGTSAVMLAVLDAAGRGSVVVLLLGVLAVTAEFRHETATVTFLQTPRRVHVMAAKAVSAVLAGSALAIVNLAVVLAVGLRAGAVQPSGLNGDVLLHVLGLLLAYPVYGLLGVGIGGLLIHQPVAIVLPLAWLLVVEDLVLHVVPHAMTRWSLGAVTAALANAGDVEGLVPVPVGGLALLGYAVLLLSLGAARVVRRDVT